MGHERIGYLPKTKKWAAVVSGVSYYSQDQNSVQNISNITLKNVRYKFNDIIDDAGVKAAFEFLILLTLIPKKENWKEVLSKKGIILDDRFSLIQIANTAKKFITENEESKEYSAVAMQSLIDSISQWTNNIKQGNLFSSHDLQTELWRNAANGSGFCELSRLFFSKFTERYLRYFLEREAFGRINNLNNLNDFSNKLEKRVDEVSIHAFETAKITQSFAAGWYNKNVKTTFPTQESIKGFISYSFKKLNSELLAEEVNE